MSLQPTGSQRRSPQWHRLCITAQGSGDQEMGLSVTQEMCQDTWTLGWILLRNKQPHQGSFYRGWDVGWWEVGPSEILELAMEDRSQLGKLD